MAYGKYVNMLIGLGSLHASLYCPTRWRRALRIMGKIDYGKRSIVKNRDILKGVKIGVNVSLIIIHWKPYATNNNKKSTS